MIYINTIPKKYLEEFQNLWDSNADEYCWFEFAKIFYPNLTFQNFDHGWQWTTILNDDIEVAKNEFILAINNWV